MSTNCHEEPTDATMDSELDLLREWFHWWRNTNGFTRLSGPPAALHVRTAAYLATVRVQAGQKIFGPRDL